MPVRMKILAHLAVSPMLPATASGRSCPEAPHSSDTATHEGACVIPVHASHRHPPMDGSCHTTARNRPRSTAAWSAPYQSLRKTSPARWHTPRSDARRKSPYHDGVRPLSSTNVNTRIPRRCVFTARRSGGTEPRSAKRAKRRDGSR